MRGRSMYIATIPRSQVVEKGPATGPTYRCYWTYLSLSSNYNGFVHKQFGDGVLSRARHTRRRRWRLPRKREDKTPPLAYLLLELDLLEIGPEKKCIRPQQWLLVSGIFGPNAVSVFSEIKGYCLGFWNGYILCHGFLSYHHKFYQPAIKIHTVH